MARVSVVIPVRDRVDLLERALKSVFAQTCPAEEVIVVDDGSAMPVSEGLRSDFLSKVTVCRCDVGINAAYARNVGIQTAQGEFIAFLDADDWWRADHLATCLAVFLAEPEADGLFGAFIAVGFAGGHLSVRRPGRAPRTDETLARYICVGGGTTRTSTMFFRRRFASKVCFDSDLCKHQDWDFAVRADWLGRVSYKRTATVYIDHRASGRMSGRANVDATERFYRKNSQLLREDEKVGFIIRTARHALESGDGKAARQILAIKRCSWRFRETCSRFIIATLSRSRGFPRLLMWCYRVSWGVRTGKKAAIQAAPGCNEVSPSSVSRYKREMYREIR